MDGNNTECTNYAGVLCVKKRYARKYRRNYSFFKKVRKQFFQKYPYLMSKKFNWAFYDICNARHMFCATKQ